MQTPEACGTNASASDSTIYADDVVAEASTFPTGFSASGHTAALVAYGSLRQVELQCLSRAPVPMQSVFISATTQGTSRALSMSIRVGHDDNLQPPGWPFMYQHS